MSEPSDHVNPPGAAPLYRDDDETALQPDAPPDSLVENEGVNAGSSESMTDGQNLPTPEATVTGDQPTMTGGSSSAGREDEGRFVGAPAQDPGFPSTAEGASGQDAGSME